MSTVLCGARDETRGFDLSGTGDVWMDSRSQYDPQDSADAPGGPLNSQSPDDEDMIKQVMDSAFDFESAARYVHTFAPDLSPSARAKIELPIAAVQASSDWNRP